VKPQRRSAWITQFYLQITPCLPLPRKRSPDGATTDCGHRHLIAAYYSSINPERMKGWAGLVGWHIADAFPTQMVTCQLQVESRTGKYAGQRPTFYHCATQPTMPRHSTHVHIRPEGLLHDTEHDLLVTAKSLLFQILSTNKQTVTLSNELLTVYKSVLYI